MAEPGDDLTPKMRRFVELIVSDRMRQVDAYREAGFKAKNNNTAQVCATRLLRDERARRYRDHLQARLRGDAIAKVGLTVSRAMEILKEIAEDKFSPEKDRVRACLGAIDAHGKGHMPIALSNLRYDGPMDTEELARMQMGAGLALIRGELTLLQVEAVTKILAAAFNLYAGHQAARELSDSQPPVIEGQVEEGEPISVAWLNKPAA